mgnify:CR=1 FL=1|tara:strand:- start:594 stop:1277 length:684 start_codon:yes stop_codon:yes gene_type:complete
MTQIRNRISHSRTKIQEYEAKYRHPTGSVKLLAVSKKHSIDSIREAARNGISNFGENYFQEAYTKIESLKSLNLIWHFIGPIQSNKTLKIANNFDWVQSVDREKIATRLNEHRKEHLSPLKICIQINLSDEDSKAGVSLKNAEELCLTVESLSNLELRGIMSIPAPESNFQKQRANFAKLRSKFLELQKKFPGMDTLSMGMTGDFEAAIAEGSTMIRLGSALFGPRA